MIIQKYMDDSYYMNIREGVTFHYFGNGCIGDYYSSSIAYLDELDIKLLNCCNDKQTVLGVFRYAKSVLTMTEVEFIQRVEKLYTRGIIVFSHHSVTSEISFSGEYGTFYPKEVTIELTSACNYSCPFCYRNATKKGEYIDGENIMKISNMLRGKVRNILLTGGEPTLHPYYQDYIGVLSEFADVHMITNGSVLWLHDPEPLKKLDHIQFSIYGCSDLEYQKMTGVRDGFSRLIKSIDLTKRHMIPVTIAVTLCDDTASHIEQFIRMAVELGMSVIRIGIADAFGRGSLLYKYKIGHVSSRSEIFKEILELKRKYRNKIRVDIPNISTEHVNDHKDMYINVYGDSLCCGCGTEHIVISPNGSIRPCQMLPEVPFSMKSSDVLVEHIQGNFHTEHLRRATRSYCDSIGCRTPDSAPCHALAEYLREEKHDDR